MRVKVIRVGLLSIFFLSLLTAGVQSRQDSSTLNAAGIQTATEGGTTETVSKAEGVNPTEKTEYTNEGKGRAENGTAESNAPITPGISDAVRQILMHGSREFFRGYPVDEAFLCWIGGTYGEDLLMSLAGLLAEEDCDAGLWYELTGNTMHVLWTEYCREHSYATYLYQNVEWQEAADPSCIKLDFVGDICFDERWHTMQAAAEGGVESCISPDVQDELQSADITMVNNEFAYTDSEEALADKAYTFKAQASSIRLLDLFGTDIVSLANNHCFDYGEEGLLDTLAALQEEDIPYSGAGKNLKEASAVHYFIVGGRKVAIVSATEIERFSSYTRKAGKNEPGVLKTQQEEYVLAAIAEARANSDYVVAYIHWGAEGKNNYDEGQRLLAQTYADAGADAIIGGHPHRLQGVTYIGDVPVAYSLGNFWFSTGTLYTTIAQLQINADGKLSLVMLPCMQKNLHTYLLDNPAEVKEFYHYLADISTDVGIGEDGCVYRFRDVSGPGESPYAYTSGRRYGLHADDTDLEGRAIDIVGNLE